MIYITFIILLTFISSLSCAKTRSKNYENSSLKSASSPTDPALQGFAKIEMAEVLEELVDRYEDHQTKEFLLLGLNTRALDYLMDIEEIPRRYLLVQRIKDIFETEVDSSVRERFITRLFQCHVDEPLVVFRFLFDAETIMLILEELVEFECDREIIFELYMKDNKANINTHKVSLEAFNVNKNITVNISFLSYAADFEVLDFRGTNTYIRKEVITPFQYSEGIEYDEYD